MSRGIAPDQPAGNVTADTHISQWPAEQKLTFIFWEKLNNNAHNLAWTQNYYQHLKNTWIKDCFRIVKEIWNISTPPTPGAQYLNIWRDNVQLQLLICNTVCFAYQGIPWYYILIGLTILHNSRLHCSETTLQSSKANTDKQEFENRAHV